MVSKLAGMGAALPQAFNVPHVRVFYFFFIERHPFLLFFCSFLTSLSSLL